MEMNQVPYFCVCFYADCRSTCTAASRTRSERVAAGWTGPTTCPGFFSRCVAPPGGGRVLTSPSCLRCTADPTSGPPGDTNTRAASGAGPGDLPPHPGRGNAARHPPQLRGKKRTAGHHSGGALNRGSCPGPPRRAQHAAVRRSFYRITPRRPLLQASDGRQARHHPCQPPEAVCRTANSNCHAPKARQALGPLLPTSDPAAPPQMTGAPSASDDLLPVLVWTSSKPRSRGSPVESLFKTPGL